MSDTRLRYYIYENGGIERLNFGLEELSDNCGNDSYAVKTGFASGVYHIPFLRKDRSILFLYTYRFVMKKSNWVQQQQRLCEWPTCSKRRSRTSRLIQYWSESSLRPWIYSYVGAFVLTSIFWGQYNFNYEVGNSLRKIQDSHEECDRLNRFRSDVGNSWSSVKFYTESRNFENHTEWRDLTLARFILFICFIENAHFFIQRLRLKIVWK